MADKFLHDPKSMLCFRASLVGGFYIKYSSSSKEVKVIVQSETDYLLGEITFGVDGWDAARKWVSDCVFVIENLDVQIKTIDKKSGRMIRLDDEGEG